MSSRSGFEDTFGGGSAFFGGAASCFTIVRVRNFVTTTVVCSGEYVADGPEYGVDATPPVEALCGAGALGAASGWIGACARGGDGSGRGDVPCAAARPVTAPAMTAQASTAMPRRSVFPPAPTNRPPQSRRRSHTLSPQRVRG